ncbi:MAG: hypothetical protein FWB85_09315 [Chitinispirillia bacterium]|nr:hypothetical protein [Chitinispirillia bacterium]
MTACQIRTLAIAFLVILSLALSGCFYTGTRIPESGAEPCVKAYLASQIYFRDYRDFGTVVVEVTQTTTGAAVKYTEAYMDEEYLYQELRHRHGPLFEFELDLELSMNEWCDLVNTLYNCCVLDWNCLECTDYVRPQCEIKIFSENGDTAVARVHHTEIEESLPNGHIFQRTMNGLIQKVKTGATQKPKTNTNIGTANHQLLAVYQGRFGEPMSDFEKTLTAVRFKDGFTYTIVRRTSTGSITAKYYEDGFNNITQLRTELDMADWLNIVRALRTYSNEWLSSSYDRENAERVLHIQSTEQIGKFVRNKYPTVLRPAVLDAMSGIKTKIWEKTGIEAFENKLNEEYMNRFGMPISAFERTIKGVRYSTDTVISRAEYSIVRELYSVDVERTTTGRILATVYNDKKRYEAELDIEEWLDFLNALYKCKLHEWSGTYKEVRASDRTWLVNVHFWGGEDDWFRSDRNGYPPTEEFRKLMTDLGARVMNGKAP